jgi:c(7)-type cytochrome triheme protein
MKLSEVMITGVALLGCIGALSAGAAPNSSTDEAVAADEKTPGQAVSFPDYEIGLFSHKNHVSSAGLQCADCHTGIFQETAGAAKANGDFNKITFGEGKYCGACHNGTAAFAIQDEANCQRCHGNDVNPPDTILLERTVKTVLFDHALHNKELGLACNECHMRLFDMTANSTAEKSDFTMEAMYNGKYCGACHNGVLGFDLKTRCSKCHADVPDADPAAAAPVGK